MKAQITGQNIDITPALREYTEDKLDKLQKLSENIISIHVTFNIHHLDHNADGQINIPGSVIHASASSTESMYTAITIMVDKLFKQLKKHHEKLVEHH